MTGRIVLGSLVLILLLLASVAHAQSWKDLLESADSLCEWQKQDSAILVGTMALEKSREAFGQQDTSVALVLHRLGVYNLYRAKYGIADSLLALALAMRKELLGDHHQDVAMTLYNLATAHRRQGKLVESEREYKASLAINEEILGPDHENVASVLDGLGILRYTQGKYSESEQLWERSLAIKEKALGPSHNEVAKTLNCLAVLYRHQGNYAESIQLYERALAIRVASHGSDHPEVARIMANLANVYSDQGQYDLAAELHEKSHAIRESCLAPNHPDVAQSLNSLGSIFKKQGRFKEAESLYRRSLKIREEVLGWDHHVVGSSLNTLGNIMVAQGKYVQADSLYRRSLAIKEKTLGGNHSDVAMILNNLGNVSLHQSKYRQAESFYERALTIREQVLSPDHPNVASSLNNLAGVYHMVGDYTRAEQLYERSVAILKKALGPDHPNVARGLGNLGSCCLHLGRYNRAEMLLTESVSMLEEALGPNHPAVVESLDNLSVLYIRMGNLAEAEAGLKRSLAIRETALGTDHPYYARSLEFMSELRRLQGDLTDALNLSKNAYQIRKRNFADNGIALSERDALAYAREVRKSVGNYLTNYINLKDVSSSNAGDAADIAISSKGQVSDEIFGRQKAIAEEPDSITQDMAESLTFAKFRLSELFVRGPGEDMESYREATDSLRSLANELESRLSLLSVSFRKRQNREAIGAERVRSLLPDGSILIEYLKYDYYHEFEPDSSTSRYLAIVVSGGEEPQIVDLGESSRIDSLVGRYRKHMLRVSSFGKPIESDLEEYRLIATDLYDRIWSPIERYVSDRDMVIVAPDGALNVVSFTGLTNLNSKYLIEKYAIHYLSCGRDLIRLLDDPETGSGLLALGDPDYDATASADYVEKDKPENIVSEDFYGSSGDKRSGAQDMRKTVLSPLPASRKEIEMIAQYWQESTDEPLKTYFGSDANEACFKKEAPGNRVIHLATHGYFLRNDLDRPSILPDRSAAADSPAENPLLHSGLFLAGANVRRENAGSRGGDDGVLTAYEVSAMNLAGADLVVLSACETGLGEVEDCEGVYGLRRAFLMAGARAVISALWPVSDRSAAEIMGRIYERKDGILPQRLRALQLGTIQRLRDSGEPDHPVQWGAFTALGDWNW